jgi:hypothetical protein
VAIPHRGTTSSSTYFLTAGTYNKINILQSDRMADFFCRTLFRYRDAGNSSSMRLWLCRTTFTCC